MKKYVFFLIIILLPWTLCSSTLKTPFLSENLIPISHNYSLKVSSNGEFVRSLDEICVNYNTIGDQESPSICALSDEVVAIAWHGSGAGDDEGIFARVFNITTGESITSEFPVNKYTLDEQLKPSICALSSEKIALTWQSNWQDSSMFGVFANVFDATTGENTTTEFQVNSHNNSQQKKPSICALNDDIFVVAWQSYVQDGQMYGIYAKVFNAISGENLTSEFQINDFVIGDQLIPSPCRFSNDVFAIAWQSNISEIHDFEIRVKLFNATSGNNVSSEFQVNSFRTSNQINPSICALSHEGIAIVWTSKGQVNGYDIFLAVFGYEDDEDGNGSFDSGFLLLIIIIILLGVAAVIVMGSFYFVKKKQYDMVSSSIRRKSRIKTVDRKNLERPPIKTVNSTQQKKMKKNAILAPGDSLSESEKEDLKQTESEVNVEKKQAICVVHKGLIEGANYLCPICNTYYCFKCAKVLIEKGEKCWVCDTKINLED